MIDVDGDDRESWPNPKHGVPLSKLLRSSLPENLIRPEDEALLAKVGGLTPTHAYGAHREVDK